MERSSVYMAELAYQYFLMSNFKEALQRYQEAYNLDELNMNAAYWKIICQVWNLPLVVSLHVKAECSFSANADLSWRYGRSVTAI